MPRLERDISNSVFFLYRRCETTGDLTGPCGTGFLVEHRTDLVWEPGAIHVYAVTNWHVAVQLGASIVRLNTGDGKTRLLEFDPVDWEFNSAGDDLAVLDISDHLQQSDLFSCVLTSDFADRAFIAQHEFGLGEDAFMLGLFVPHHGGERNIPMARFGNVAMIADDNAPILQERGRPRPSHIVDMRSRTGFSGSPVFVYRTPADDLRNPNSIGWTSKPDGNRFLKLLGIHTGQFGEPLEVKLGERHGDPVKEGDVIEIPSSMTSVVPSDRIADLLEIDVFAEARKRRSVDGGSTCSK
jgi:hypothetical protein